MSRLPTLNGLQAFEATARHMSFQKAAEELNLTPSALSYQVKTLEDQLGVALFERRNRSIVFTDDGSRLYPEVREGFERLRLGLRRLTAPTPDNVLVVSTGPSFAAKWLAPRLFRFMDLHPEIEVRISASLKLVDFRADEVDVAVRFGRGPYEGLEQRRILGETVTVLASPGFLAAHSIAHPQDLLALPLIHDESMRFVPDAIGWVEWFAAQGITVGEVRGPRFNHADHALDAAVRGSGATLGRTTVAAEDMRNGLLVEPFPERRIDTDMAFFLVAPQAALARPKVKAFSDWIMAETAGDPPV